MFWENKHNLPDRVIRVIKGNYKDRQPEINRLSVTDLIEEPLPRILYISQYDKIVRDYSDMLTMVQGTALHSRYEVMATDDEDAEHKFEDVVDGIIVVGMADSYFEKIIMDVKQTGVYGPKYRMDKWTKQCNIYAHQRRIRKQEVDKILIDVWYRDWKIKNTSWKDYPKIPYECIELPLWEHEKCLDYIHSQVEQHLSYTVHDNIEDYTTPCSNKQRGIRFEIYKNKNKTPTKVEDTHEEAKAWVDASDTKFKWNIVESEPVFCQRYCKARSVCPFGGKE